MPVQQINDAHEALKGYRTYIAVFAYIAYAVLMYLNGSIEPAEAGRMVLEAVGAAYLRKAIPAPPTTAPDPKESRENLSEV